MTNEEIIKYTDKWRESKEFDGYNCDDTEIRDGELVYDMESSWVDGWVRSVSIRIPEDFSTWSDGEQKSYLDSQYKSELIDWIDDGDSLLENIAMASGLDIAYADIVSIIVNKYDEFHSALEGELRNKL